MSVLIKLGNMICHNSSVDDEKETVFREIRQEYLKSKPPLQIRGLGGMVAATHLVPESVVLHQMQLQDLKEQEKDFSDMRNRIIDKVNPCKRLYEITLGRSSKYQPPIQYRIAFVKHIIKQLESAEKDKPRSAQKDDDDEEDVITLWYDALESLTSLGTLSEPFYRLYNISSGSVEDNVVKIFENESAFVAEGTTGLVTWEASIQLSKWLNSVSQKSKNPRWILELGCGCGFLAVAALNTFSTLSTYIASDGHSSALEKCKVNLQANFATLKSDVVQTELIDWQKDEGKFREIVKKLNEEYGPGTLLGADIVFDPDLIPPLVKLIDMFLEADEYNNTQPDKDSTSNTCYLACTIRNETTFEALKNHLFLDGDLKRSVNSAHKWTNGVILEIKRKK